MATHLIVYGHGAGDPGAVGYGTNERDFNRNVLHPHIKKWADKSKDSFVFFDTTGNKDLFQETAKGWGMYGISRNQYASVTEIHEDAASSSATGGHNIIYKDFNADKHDLNLAQTIKNIVGWWGSVQGTQGISKRDNLLNLNVAAQRGINYRLMELGFITSKNDMDKIKTNLDSYARGIVEGITGEKLTDEVKPDTTKYWDKTGRYILLKDDTFYVDLDFKKRSGWVMPKGAEIYVDQVIQHGNVYRGAVQLGNVVRYITLNKKLIEKK